MARTSLRRIAREALRRAPWGLLVFFLAACSRNEPLEARLAELQERRLWRAQAAVFAPEEYHDYLRLLRGAKDELIEAGRWQARFRSNDALVGRFTAVLARGEEIGASLPERRGRQQAAFAERLAAQRDKIERLDRLTTLISVGSASREFLAKAGLLAAEAEARAGRGQYPEADERLQRAQTFTQLSRDVVASALKRFVDAGQISFWRRKVDETIRESKLRGSYAIVVSKVERQLFLYKSGRLVKTFEVGLGARSVSDKVCAGDRATPEGKYRVTKKVARSRFHKALLINYPNEEDWREFSLAKSRGAIPRRAGIGGLIEIHGGGKDGQTHGCVALDNHQMDEIFALADVDTPVTIVGARDYENSVVRAMRGL